MYVDTIPELDGDPDWSHQKIGYMNVFEREQQKFVFDLKTRQDIDLQDDDWYEGRDPSQRQDWMRTYKHVRQKTIDCIDRRHGATGDYGTSDAWTEWGNNVMRERWKESDVVNTMSSYMKIWRL